MSMTPALVFLHGVGNGFEDRGWMVPLDRKLRELGYPGLDGVDVRSPQYPHSLRPHRHDEEYELPPLTVEPPKGARAARRRRAVELEAARYEALLGEYREEAWWSTGVTESELSSKGSWVLKQVKAYRTDDQVRARVLQRILAQVPDEGPVVLIGHSLGSVIALDVVRRLNPKVRVRALITIGSPLAHSMFEVHADRMELRSPPENVDCWVNFWSAGDPVTFGTGAGRRFPWVLDQQVGLGRIEHRAVKYLGRTVVAKAVGIALFGSLSKELQVASSLPEPPLSPMATRQLMELAYAHCLRSQLKGDAADRFQGALAIVQSERAAALHEAYVDSEHRPHSSIQELMEARFAVPPYRPTTPVHLDVEEAAQMLVGIAMTNPLAPFEIEVGDKERREALAALSSRMGLTGSFGHDAHDAVQFARRQLKASRNGLRWAVAGMGAVALVASTGGLAALLAAPGLAGAAAVTSALAAFGPGGMVGGLVTAGLLTGGGASVVTGALVRQSTLAEVEESVTYQVALSKLRHERNLEHAEDQWIFLVSLTDELQSEVRRFAPFSDPKAASVVALRQKLDVATRALDLLRARGWAPVEPDEDAEAPEGAVRAEVIEVLDVEQV